MPNSSRCRVRRQTEMRGAQEKSQTPNPKSQTNPKFQNSTRRGSRGQYDQPLLMRAKAAAGRGSSVRWH